MGARLFLGIGGVVSKRYDTKRAALTWVECGFNRAEDSRAPMSLRFFIFAVFDVELVLVLPVLLRLHESLEVGVLYSVYCFLLSAGLLSKTLKKIVILSSLFNLII